MTEDRDYSDDSTTADNSSELLENKRRKLIEEQHVLENEIAKAP